ncbi:MAG: M1 family metallopeptidase, partial [Nonlabens sp.]|nr:M1 family metallopeptidase [Nonlabens sp.]
MKKTFFALIAITLSALSIAQNSPSQIDKVDFTKATVDLFVNQQSTIISGTITYEFDILKDTDSIFLDAKNITRYSTLLDGTFTNSNLEKEMIVVKSRFRESEHHTLLLEFSTDPTKALYHIDSDGDGVWDQLWTQGQGKYTSNWMPSVDDMNDKIEWDITVTAPKQYTVLTNGALTSSELIDSNRRWRYDMSKPMSSYLVALVVGTYDSLDFKSGTGTPISLYYYPKDSNKVDATYAYTLNMFNFLESEIGIAYPWENYKQVPVKDFLYSGMENTSLTIFSDEFVNDAIGAIDRPYVNVNAHELAHQWFGDLVTEQSGTDHWLHEGFATYYALLAERNIHGDDYYYMQLYNNAERLYEQSQDGTATALLDANGSSLTFYEHGAWALHALRDLVGDNAYRESVKTYLKNYAFKNVTTADFLNVVSNTSGKDLNAYKAMWLTNTAFPLAESLRLLRKNAFMNTYLQLAARRTSSFDEALRSYEEVLDAKPNQFLLQEVVTQLNIHNDLRKYALLKKAAGSGDTLVRQTIALTTQELTGGNQAIIEDMLNDPSYVTREQVLFLLWNGNTTKRKTLLQEVKKTWKETNPSLNMAYAALALNTPEFSQSELLQFMKDLQKFTAPQQSIATRTAAFDYLVNMGIMNEQNYKDLVDAALHHNWRFYSNAREILKKQYKSDPDERAL